MYDLSAPVSNKTFTSSMPLEPRILTFAHCKMTRLYVWITIACNTNTWNILILTVTVVNCWRVSLRRHVWCSHGMANTLTIPAKTALVFCRLALHDNRWWRPLHLAQWATQRLATCPFFKQWKHNPGDWILSFWSVTLSLTRSQQRSVARRLQQNVHASSGLVCKAATVISQLTLCFSGTASYFPTLKDSLNVADRSWQWISLFNDAVAPCIARPPATISFIMQNTQTCPCC